MPFKFISSSSTPNSLSLFPTSSFILIKLSFDLVINSFAVSSSIASIFDISSALACEISSTLWKPSETKSWPKVSSTSKFLINDSVFSLNSNCLLSESSLSVKISISKFVNLEANLTFCPLLPMALLKFSSLRITSIFLFVWSIKTFWISAGDKILKLKLANPLSIL